MMLFVMLCILSPRLLRPWLWRSSDKRKRDETIKVKILTTRREEEAHLHVPLARFVVDCLFLCELIERLTLTDKEDVTYIAGIRLGSDRVLTRLIPVDLDSSSVAHANANPVSCAEVMIRLVEADLPLVAMAHSHPGTHPESTRPSPVDLRYMSTLEANGAKIIGLIVNRGGCVRFFSAAMPFEVFIQGNEFKRVSKHDHVYQLAP
jgi:hypothetical protein